VYTHPIVSSSSTTDPCCAAQNMGCGGSSAQSGKGNSASPAANEEAAKDCPTMEEPATASGTTAAEEAEENEKIKIQQGRSRRAGVASESIDNQQIKDYVKPVHPKDEVQKTAITTFLKDNVKMQVLVGHLDTEKIADVVNAFYPKRFETGKTILKQGDEGDCCYMIANGDVAVFVARPGHQLGENDLGTKVCDLGAGALFGELALMYNAPRAATVTATTAVDVYVLDKIDFKMLLVQSSQAQYAQYEGWLREVDILKTLNNYELTRLADILSPDSYSAGEAIVTQGEEGQRFYILEEGTVAAYISGDAGEMEVMTYDKQGSYFGEVALLRAEPRKATVRATGKGCRVVSVSKEDFSAVLGPISDILGRQAESYPAYAEFLK